VPAAGCGPGNAMACASHLLMCVGAWTTRCRAASVGTMAPQERWHVWLGGESGAPAKQEVQTCHDARPGWQRKGKTREGSSLV